jgi:hypothetical protein
MNAFILPIKGYDSSGNLYILVTIEGSNIANHQFYKCISPITQRMAEVLRRMVFGKINPAGAIVWVLI